MKNVKIYDRKKSMLLGHETAVIVTNGLPYHFIMLHLSALAKKTKNL